MPDFLTAARIFMAAVSLVAIVGAPFVIMNTKPVTATTGYGLQVEQLDRADAALTANG